MIRSVFDSLASLKLTIGLLCAGTVLVFAGTLAQVDMGLYAAQNAYFRSLLVYWGPQGATWKIPILPGGYLVGSLMVLNLTASLIKTFEFSRAHFGLMLSHGGVILLLIGQLATDMLAVESHMRLGQGRPSNYSENGRDNELVLVDITDPKQDKVVSIPEGRLAQGGRITDSGMPFTLRVLEYQRNSTVGFQMGGGGGSVTNGVAAFLRFQKEAPVTKLEARDIPAAAIEVLNGEKSVGAWWVSGWVEEAQLAQSIANQAGPAVKRLLEQPQTFQSGGRTWRIALRPMRFYKPFSLELVKFTHKKYSGTEIPKDFSSRVRLRRPDTGESREVLIYMNNPLRYAGETFYQSGYDENDPSITILQVVRNPGWLTPYLACGLVSVGLVYHFIMHLLNFTALRRKR